MIEQIRWERDTAVSQLREIGKSFGEKMDDVKEMIERNKPKKPVMEEKLNVPFLYYYKCQNCGQFVGDNYVRLKYCNDCGQAIEWEVEEWKDC